MEVPGAGITLTTSTSSVSCACMSATILANVDVSRPASSSIDGVELMAGKGGAGACAATLIFGKGVRGCFFDLRRNGFSAPKQTIRFRVLKSRLLEFALQRRRYRKWEMMTRNRPAYPSAHH